MVVAGGGLEQGTPLHWPPQPQRNSCERLSALLPGENGPAQPAQLNCGAVGPSQVLLPPQPQVKLSLHPMLVLKGSRIRPKMRSTGRPLSQEINASRMHASKLLGLFTKLGTKTVVRAVSRSNFSGSLHELSTLKVVIGVAGPHPICTAIVPITNSVARIVVLPISHEFGQS